MKKLYLKEQSRLAFFKEKADADFEDLHWDNVDIKKRLHSYTSDSIFVPTVKKYLPQESKVTEGGCGHGLIVRTLKYNGYNAVGVDFAAKTVKLLNNIAPELDIQLGDVRRLNFPDESFDGYISGGIIEHFINGHEDIISEMHRVLKKTVIFLSLFLL